jgi:hypothetical protein
MYFYIQWSTDPPQGWQRYESVEELLAVPADLVPPDDHKQGDMKVRFSDRPGWIHAVCVQGVVFDEYDHYCIERLEEDGLRVTVWIDDEKDWADSRMAIRMDFGAVTSNEDGFPNTDISRTHWSTSDKRRQWTKEGRLRFDFDWFDWEDFIPPRGKVFHGIWMQNKEHHEHLRLRERHSWREWI